jgi:hypothetical protein
MRGSVRLDVRENSVFGRAELEVSVCDSQHWR